MIDIRHAAQLLGGEVAGRQVLCPGVGHSRADRSLAVRFEPWAPEGFVVHSFAGDDVLAARDHIRDKLGLPAWKPGAQKGKGAKLSPPGGSQPTHIADPSALEMWGRA